GGPQCRRGADPDRARDGSARRTRPSRDEAGHAGTDADDARRETGNGKRETMRRAVFALTFFTASLPLLAQTASPDPRPPILRNVGIAQRLDRPLPLDLPFRDEAGRTVHPADYYGKHPVVVVLAYYNCPLLCSQ